MTLFNKISRIFGRRSARISAAMHEADDGTRHFLVIFDPVAGRLVATEEFEDDQTAEDAYLRAERAHRDDEIQVVLFAGESLEAVRGTHPHYFEDRSDEPSTAPFPAIAP